MVLCKLPFLIAGVCSCALLAQNGPPTATTPPGPNADYPENWINPLTELDGHLPRWLRLTGQYRMRGEGSRHIKFGNNIDGYLLGRLRLGVEIQPNKWIKFAAVTQDSRVYDNDFVASAPPFRNRWDIWEAYAEIGNAKEGWFDLKGGRQVLSFGDERLIGPSDWLNTGRTFDAIRLDLHHGGSQVSLFASSVVLARDGVLDHHLQGNNLHGAYGSFKNLIPKAAVEPYVFWRVAPGAVRLSENAGHGALNEVTLGIRAVGKLPAGLDYNVEMDRQLGSLGPYSIEAWAGHWNAGRTLGGGVLGARPFAEFDYASGTDNPSSKTWGTFDQLYPSGHDKLDLADQIGWRNIKEVRFGVEETFGKKWKAKQTYESFWLASTHDGLYTTNGSQAVAPISGFSNSHIGEEFDATLEYRWHRGDILGTGYGRLFTGSFLNRATPGRDYAYPYAYATFGF